MYTILIAGAGYTGLEIGNYFYSQKQKVYGIVRSAESAQRIESAGITPIRADLTHSASLNSLPPAHFIVLCAAPDQGTEDAYRHTYLSGTRCFLEVLKKGPRPALLVQISSTSVWRDREGGWVDENTPADSDQEKAKILKASEALVLGSGIPSVVLRCAGIYGPGRNRLQAFQEGKWPAPSDKPVRDGYMNLIHVADIARLMKLLFKSAVPGKVYAGVDNEPVLRSEFCAWLSGKTGRNLKKSFEGPPEGKRISNNALRELGYSFLHPTFREGYESFLTT